MRLQLGGDDDVYRCLINADGFENTLIVQTALEKSDLMLLLWRNQIYMSRLSRRP